MIKLLPIILILFLTLGATPKAVINGPEIRKENQSIFLDARDSVSDVPLKWQLLNNQTPFLTFDRDDRKNVFAFMPDPEPGFYKFVLIAIGNGTEVDVVVHEVLVESDLDPDPDPDPIPSDKVVYATLVFDQELNDVNIALLRTDPTIIETARQLNIQWKSYDDDSEAVKHLKLLPYVSKLPGIVVQDGLGHVLQAVVAPTTSEQVISYLKSLRKK